MAASANRKCANWTCFREFTLFRHIAKLLAVAKHPYSLALAAALSAAPQAGVSPQEVQAHRIGSIKPVRSANAPRGWRAVAVDVIVDSGGYIASVRAVNCAGDFCDEAVAHIKELRYQPFEFEGKAVSQEFTEYVPVLPLEKLPDRHTPFPEVKDWESMKIALKRTQCFGTCPSYQVEIRGDGSVSYKGEAYVASEGQRASKISAEQVKELVQLFRQADFFSLDDEYRFNVTDNPTYTISIAFDRQSKQVVDYAGQRTGMPQAVTDLENAIDRIAGTAQWVKR
jgi:hypothetical protein